MNSKNISRVLILLLFLLFQSVTGLAPKPVLAQNLDNITIELENVVSGLSSPVAVKNAGDGSGLLFIVEQAGRILIYDGNQLLPVPFLDINSLVSCCGERGLLDVEFHPNYAANGFFYVHYTDNSGNTVIARYTRSAVDPLLADPGSAIILLNLFQPAANHNGGQMEFGPDGFLYIALGDGGISGMSPTNPAQDLGQLLGKILRIDVDGGVPYAIPTDNPFVGAAGDVREEIWAIGLRNPWRMSFDRQTGDLLIADVGQNRFEEVNFQSASSPGGENYGWPLMEGNSCFNPANNCNDGSLTLPILEYDHSAGNCSITGGYRYRGSAFPQMRGVYFYGDYCSGRIWGGATDINGNWTNKLFLDVFNFGLTTFGEGESGEVYLVDSNAGNLFRINQINIPADSNDVVMNHPSSGVSVLFNDNSSSSVLHPDTAEAIATADVDGNGQDDVIVSFISGNGPGGTGGTFISRNQGALVLLDSKIANQIVVGDLDNNGQDDLLLDFGADGFWIGFNDLAPFLVINLPPIAMAAGDIDNNGQDDIVLSFPGFVTFSLANFTDFVIVDNSPADALAVADVDGNGQGDVIASFPSGTGPGGTGGTFVSRNQGALTQLDSKVAEQITSGDFDDNGQDDLLLDFGTDGLWLSLDDLAPILVVNLPVIAMASGDLDNNGVDDMMFSFTGFATLALKNLTTVDILDPGIAQHLATGNVDGN